MSLRCPLCGSSNFRASRFRVEDIAELLVLKYPVRCLICLERSYGFAVNLIGMKRRGNRRKAEAALNGPQATSSSLQTSNGNLQTEWEELRAPTQIR
jgi:hypothetical protein